MANKGAPELVKAFVAVLGSDDQQMKAAAEALTGVWGPLDLRSQVFPFAHTDYYEAEMGADLRRQFFAFERLVDPGQLPELKEQAALLEDQLASDGRRPVNLDPGYLDYNKVVLASYKAGGQKIYMRDGVYADMVLLYERGQFNPFIWTFPDFVGPDYAPVLTELRRLYRRQRRQAEGRR